MTDEHKLLRDQERAMKAQLLLDNELLKEAFQDLEDSYIMAWRSTTIDNVNAREKLFLAINVLGKVHDHLSNIVNNGKLAQSELRQLVEVREREKRWHEVR